MIWDTNILDAIDIEFLNAFTAASGEIFKAGQSLAYWLALISMGFSIGMMLLKGEEVHVMCSKLIKMGILFGLFFTLIQYGGTWIPQFLNGFIAVGQKASGIESVDPSSVFNQGWYIASKLIKGAYDAGMYHILSALAALFGAFFIIIIYALISASLCVLYIKSYALVLIGPIIFALGNNDVTRSTVSNYIQKIIGMGLNLLFYYLVIGVGISLGDQWVQNISEAGLTDFSILAMILGGIVVFYQVLQNVPSFIATISGATGFRDYGQAAIAAAASGAAMMAQAAVSAGTLGGAGVAGAGIATRATGAIASGAMSAGKAGAGTFRPTGWLGQGQHGAPMPGKMSAATSFTGKLMAGFEVAGRSLGNAGGAGIGATAGGLSGLGKHVFKHGVKPAMNSVADKFNGDTSK